MSRSSRSSGSLKMFHKSNYGSAGESLPSDIRGYVPEAGDDHADMVWDGMEEWTDETWADYMADAIAATAKADADLNAWRAGNAA